MRYRIYYTPANMQKTLAFHVSEYGIDNGVISFRDEKTGKIKILDMRLCEIEVLEE